MIDYVCVCVHVHVCCMGVCAVCVYVCFSKVSNGSEEEDSQALGPLLLLVRAMPNSTRTVSNNALRLVPTASGPHALNNQVCGHVQYGMTR